MTGTSLMATATKLKLHTMLGNYPNTKPLKTGAVHCLTRVAPVGFQ